MPACRVSSLCGDFQLLTGLDVAGTMVEIHDLLDRDTVALADLEQGVAAADGVDCVTAGSGRLAAA